MIFTYFMAGVAFAIPELVIVYNCNWIRRLIERNPIIELTFSLALSWALAAVMGIGVGVTIAIANVISTAITLFFYHFHVIENYQKVATKTKQNKAKMQTILDDVHTVVHVISAPFRLVRAILHWIAEGIRWCQRMGARAKRAHT